MGQRIQVHIQEKKPAASWSIETDGRPLDPSTLIHHIASWQIAAGVDIPVAELPPMEEDANADDYKLTLIKMQRGPESVELKLSELWQAKSSLSHTQTFTHTSYIPLTGK